VRSETEEIHVPLLGISGRIGSVLNECRQARHAVEVLLFTSGAEMGREVSAASDATALYRESQIPVAAEWGDREVDSDLSRQYTQVLQAALSRSNWMSCVRIPGGAKYMDALDDAVQAALSGEATPQEALEAAADNWRRITSELGHDQQQAAYAQSLGLEP
jgi:multiple sugar transport system substrate-binding protein